MLMARVNLNHICLNFERDWDRFWPMRRWSKLFMGEITRNTHTGGKRAPDKIVFQSSILFNYWIIWYRYSHSRTNLILENDQFQIIIIKSSICMVLLCFRSCSKFWQDCGYYLFLARTRECLCEWHFYFLLNKYSN